MSGVMRVSHSSRNCSNSVNESFRVSRLDWLNIILNDGFIIYISLLIRSLRNWMLSCCRREITFFLTPLRYNFINVFFFFFFFGTRSPGLFHVFLDCFISVFDVYVLSLGIGSRYYFRVHFVRLLDSDFSYAYSFNCLIFITRESFQRGI